MNWLRSIRTRFRAFFRKRQLDAEMDEEMRSHIELRTQAKIEAGMNPEEARFAALRQFGWTESIKETCRDQRGVRWLEKLVQDIRYGARQLRKNPGFTAVAVLTLALGIGANTSLFTIFNAVALRPLPVRDPARLVNLYGQIQDERNYLGLSYPDFTDFREQKTVFSGLAASAWSSLNLEGVMTESGDEQASAMQGQLVSVNYFTVLGVPPMLGRAFLPEEDQPGASAVAILGHQFWRHRFAGEANVLGKTVKLNGHSFTIVGVAAPSFSGTSLKAPDMWIPLATQSQVMAGRNELNDRGARWLEVIGRLQPGVRPAEAKNALAVVAQRLALAYPETNHKMEIALTPATALHPEARRIIVPTAVLIMAAVGLVLLIACANVANLFLARAADRSKEIAIRLSLGATRWRLVRQLLTESVLIAVIGGSLALLAAYWFSDLWLALVPPHNGRPMIFDVTPDWRVFGYTLSVSFFAGIAFGLTPALRSSRPTLTFALKESGHVFGGEPSPIPFQSILVVTQVGSSLFLLICAGLLVRALQRAHSIDPGFETRQVAVISVDFAQQGYDDRRAAEFYGQLIERLKSNPIVRSLGQAFIVPLGNRVVAASVVIEGNEPTPDTRNIPFNVVSPDFFSTLGIGIVQGRSFEERESGTPVAIANETMARRFWPNVSAIGKRFKRGDSDWIEIVGVAKDTRSVALWEVERPYLYFPMDPTNQASMRLFARVDAAPAAALAELRALAQSIDPRLQFGLTTLSENLKQENGTAPLRVGSVLSAGIGLLALVLAAGGIYGVMAYVVSRRTREIGIRMALGACKSHVLRLVLAQSMRLVGIGLVLGLACALALSRVLAGFLYGLSAFDPVTFVCVSLFLASVALSACYVPARRAMRIDPAQALRAE